VIFARLSEKGDFPGTRRPRIGLFGLFGSGNIGNDGSLEAMLAYLRASHPDAVLDVKCPGPNRVHAIYGVTGTAMRWYTQYANRTSGATAVALKMIGKGVDAFRTMSWVRQQDAVIVPGTGILENTLPLRPTGTPYELFLMTASGRLFKKKVALVSVGANRAKQPLTRWFFRTAAGLASYRSYRDVQSRESMREAGLDTTYDNVYPDLVFSLPAPPDSPRDGSTVAVCVMAYYGSSDDRRDAEQIYASYVEKMTRFVTWLVDTGHRVRLFWGDDVDDVVTQEILADLRANRPDLAPGTVEGRTFSSLGELIGEMALVGTVVGTRYHNVLCGIKLFKPTISVGYSAKHEALMADMDLSEFSLPVQTLDVDKLVEQFMKLESRADEVRETLMERTAAKGPDLDYQFDVLSSLLFPSLGPAGHGSEMLPPERQFA
jgi:polysaccharide pyruvyl transferase WcaK-like protein